MQWQGWLQWLLVGIVVTMTVSACGDDLVKRHNASTAYPPAMSCRVVRHAMGETCVPENPHRIVVLSGHAADAMFSLGLKPVGAISNISTSWAGEMQDVVEIGQSGQVNLERILTLKPDLILGSKWDAKDYDLFKAIAPTVLDNTSHWQDTFTLYAEALGKTQQAEQLMNAYQKQVQKLRERLQGKQQEIKISLVRIYSDNRIGLYLKNSFAGTILNDIGLARPSLQNEGIVGKMPFQIVINKELIQAADGDAIFAWTFGATSQIAQSAKQALWQIQTDLLWLKLNAVQQEKVYVVGDYWHVASTPTQAMWVIDDLEKHLLN